MLAIDLRKATRTYPATGGSALNALDNVDLAVEPGEFLAIVGPSGSGKSTMLNILGCLDAPTTGTLRIAGNDVSAMNARQLADLRNRAIGFIFQSFNLIPTISALRNVELPMTYAGVPRAERRNRALAALGQVGLGDRSGHFPNQMSGGQQQRVAVARSIVNNPTFILADEPTGNLDSESTESVLSVISDLHAAGTTIILITHESDVAARADRVLTMTDGKVISDTRAAAPDAPGRSLA